MAQTLLLLRRPPLFLLSGLSACLARTATKGSIGRGSVKCRRQQYPTENGNVLALHACMCVHMHAGSVALHSVQHTALSGLAVQLLLRMKTPAAAAAQVPPLVVEP